MGDAQLTERTVIRRRKAPELAVKDPDFLVACMAERDLTRRDVAALVGCSATFISNLATGRAKGCRSYTAQKIARALGRPTQDLFEAGVAPKQRPRRATNKAA